MNRDDLVKQYGTPQKAAQAIIDGKVQLVPNDYENLGTLCDVVVAVKLGVNVETKEGK